jgi:MFS family permease
LGSRYRAFLAIPGAARLLVSSVIGRLPLGINFIAILLLVRHETGSFGLAGLVVGASGLAGAAAAPVQGMLVDRLGQFRVLVACSLGQATMLCLLVVAVRGGAPSAVLVLLGALSGALVPPISACTRVLWREITPEGAVREAAYAVDAVTQEIIFTAGPLVLAALVTISTPTAGVLLAAAVTVAGTLLFASSPLSRHWRPSTHERSIESAFGSAGFRSLIASTALTGISGGMAIVAIPALAVEVGTSGDAGILIAVWNVGSMIGGIGYGARAWRSSIDRRYEKLLLLMGVTVLPLAFVHSLPAALVLCFLAGPAWAPLLSCQYMLVSRLALPGAETAAFTWNMAAIAGGFALGSAIAGTLVDQAGVSATFGASCGAAVVGAGVALLSGRRLRVREQAV